MFEIDRSLIVVKPKQPFLDWAQTVDYQEGLTLEQVREDATAYLIPEPWDKDEQAEILKWCYEFIFEAELESWYTDPDLWPQHRDLETFREWFDVEFHSLVFDLCDEPIQVIDYGPEEDDEPHPNGN